MLRFPVFSRGFRAAYRSAHRRFLADLGQPERAQARLLAQLVREMSATQYGRHHGLSADDGYVRFAAKLPIVDYEDLAPWVRAQQSTHAPVLCPGGPLFYERTSGSSGAVKDIPYTRGLRASFVRMFLSWAYDCLEHGPRLESGRTFLSVSPGSSHGLQDDTDYLSVPLRLLFGRYLVLPRGLRRVRDTETFKRVLAACLLVERELEVVSIWNPSYFSSLLDFIDTHRSQVAADLRAGQIDAGARIFRFAGVSTAERRRCAEIVEAGTLDLRAIWPRLRLLSCWADGNAALVLEPLLRRLPHAALQGKGLIATEAPITIPLWHAAGPVPFVSEVFFELARSDGGICRLHDLEPGCRYDLIISQRGGFARYRIGDQVEAGERYLGTPTLRFVGRSRLVSDLVGEKLNENFVRDALRGVAERWMLLPSFEHGRAHYVCLVVGSPLCNLVDSIEKRLRHAHHYQLARELGQLAPLVVVRHDRLDEAYLEWNRAHGRKLGNVKPCALICDVERARSFLEYLRLVAARTHGASA